jgi:hypothetical protein
LVVRTIYTSNSLYEWNVDRMIEYEIINTLNEMIMFSNVYKTDRKRTDHQIANCLVTGFAGQLKDEEWIQILLFKMLEDEGLILFYFFKGNIIFHLIMTQVYSYYITKL